jgi:hypothetical protein
MPGKSFDLMWLARIGLIVLLVGLRLVFKQDWLGNLLLVGGWVLGYLLVEADHWFYVAVCSPQELSCQRIKHELALKNWSNARAMLQQTASERSRLPIHNILTGFIISVMGIWLAMSGGNLLAVGVITGLAVRLFTEFLADANYGRWYWIFARELGRVVNFTIVFFGKGVRINGKIKKS